MKACERIGGWLIVIALCVISFPRMVSAQSQDDGWRVSIYPLYAWIPLEIGIDVNVPPIDTGGGGSGPGFDKIVDSRFDGAFMGGLSAAKGNWRVEADGMWAAVGGDRLELPKLRVDVDAIYGHANGGRRIFSDVYLTGGVRRLALKYDIEIGSRQFDRKPGFWDPLIGVGWHHMAGTKLEFHGTFEGGGFGVGSDSDFSGSLRLDWKPAAHFGLTGGYNYLYFKVSDEVLGKTFIAKQTMHGPLVGIGLYF